MIKRIIVASALAVLSVGSAGAQSLEVQDECVASTEEKTTSPGQDG